MRIFARAALAAIVFASTGVASAQFLLIPDSSGDTIMQFDAFDGSLIKQDYIDMSALGGTPKQASQVGDEIWVSNQINDVIHRFDQNGVLLGEIGAAGGLDNIRGFEVVGNKLYLSNSGTNNGAPGDAVVVIDVPSQMIGGSFLVGDTGAGDPFDVLAYNGGLLIDDIATDDIDMFGLDGTFQSEFHNSDGVSGIDFPQQMALASGDRVLVAGFSPPAGIFIYDNNGAQVEQLADGNGARGVYELGNGNIMFTTGSGVFVIDRANGDNILTILGGVSGQYIEPAPLPEPASLLLFGLGALVALRRR